VEQASQVAHIHDSRPHQYLSIVADDEVEAIAGVQVEAVSDCLRHD